MFYSHEVLTSRKYGVATVWLVATLGSRSTLKKVSRKAILDVDVEKACDTIVTQEVPMALRLQSNLLYGVAQVYSQQCGFVLRDVETARNNMRTIFKVKRTSELTFEPSKGGRGDHLILEDDPNFLPEFELVPSDFDNDHLDLATIEESQHFTASVQSSQMTRQRSGSSQDAGVLIIPKSTSTLDGGLVGGMPSSSAHVQGQTERTFRPSRVLGDDLGLHINEDGILVMEEAEVDPRHVATLTDGSEIARKVHASARRAVSNELADDAKAVQLDNDDYMPVQDDDLLEPQMSILAGRDGEHDQIAATRFRTRSGPKPIPLDLSMELRNGDLALWNTNYAANMNEVICRKNAQRDPALAKNNAKYYILDQGAMPGPLAIFSGSQLIEALTGLRVATAGEKHPREHGDNDDDVVDRRVRHRDEMWTDQVVRGLDDYSLPLMAEDDIEQGREAPTPLDDRFFSSLMPWSQGTGSHRTTGLFSGAGLSTSASHGGVGVPFGILPRRGSRLTSASPIQHRCPFAAADLDDFQFLGSLNDVPMTGDDDAFEHYGPAAQVDTQTAGQSQWQRHILDTESSHFLEFVRVALRKLHHTREQTAHGDIGDGDHEKGVDFETLLPPEQYSCIVAAQGFLHILSLSTKGLLAVNQADGFGTIKLSTTDIEGNSDCASVH